ncbi:MAG: cellulase family glycosylhydrolase [Ruminococcus sp.]|nr:cellulase family glycosylhydrolase [Ruminococcus sp.]
MKKAMKAVAAFVSAAALAFTGAAPFADSITAEKTITAAALDDTGDDWLHAEGSRLYDMNGNEVWLTGANWFGANCSENAPHGLYACDVDVFLKNVADRGINVIRFPISTELIVSWKAGEPDPVSSVQASYNPPVDTVGEDGTVTPAGKYGNFNKDFCQADGKTLKNSEEIFDIIIRKCKEYGIKAFIDIHSPDENNSGHDYNLWYGKAGVTTEIWMDTLVWLADKYKNDDTVLGFDLKNEPHGKREYSGTKCPDTIAKWDGSTDENNWAYAATTCADKILEVNPHALIFIEGVEQYPKTELGYTYDTPDIFDAPADKSPWYGAWWGGNLRGVREYPITPKSGTSQIVYSPHDYGPSVYKQTWFEKDFTEQTLLDDYWYDTWAYINKENIAPLLIGEWGGHMDGTKNQTWMELLRDFMIKNHINHTFWCLNPNSGDTAGLLSYDFLKWDEVKYGMFEEALWQTQKTGKYIGLDHQVALGENGISLNDYIANYAKVEGSNIDGGSTPEDVTPVTGVSSAATTTTTTTKTNAATTTTTTTTTTATTTVKKESKFLGDVTLDGQISVADIVAVLQYSANNIKYKLDEDALANGDVNGDGDVNAKDAFIIQKVDAKLIAQDSLPVAD